MERRIQGFAVIVCVCMLINRKNNGADGQLFYDEQVFVVILSYLNKADVSL